MPNRPATPSQVEWQSQKFLEHQWDMLESLRQQTTKNAEDIAVIKAKVALYAGALGSFGGLVSGAIVYYLKLKG